MSGRSAAGPEKVRPLGGISRTFPFSRRPTLWLSSVGEIFVLLSMGGFRGGVVVLEAVHFNCLITGLSPDINFEAQI